MSAVDEVSALTQSIGEHAVSGIGREHISRLSVVVNSNDMTARVVVKLRENSEAEQTHALESLFDVQELFFDEVSMTFAFGHDESLDEARAGVQRAYQYA
jgi:hypothetical protein